LRIGLPFRRNTQGTIRDWACSILLVYSRCRSSTVRNVGVSGNILPERFFVSPGSSRSQPRTAEPEGHDVDRAEERQVLGQMLAGELHPLKRLLAVDPFVPAVRRALEHAAALKVREVDR